MPRKKQKIDAPNMLNPDPEKKNKINLPAKHVKLFEKQFNHVLTRITQADPVHQIMKEANIPETFLNWVFSDERLTYEFERAQQLGCEVLAGQMLDLTQNPPEDLHFAQMKMQVLKYLMASWNKKRYGDIKQIEQNVAVDISQAMEAASARVITGQVIDGE